MAQVRMIAVDLDGTLLAREGRPGERNAAALRAAEAAGITVVVATGRRHCYAMRPLREVGLGPETVLVSSNGTVTRTMGQPTRLLDRNLMSVERARQLCGHLDDFRNALVITFDKVLPDGEDERGSLVVEELANLHASIGKWMEANAAYIENMQPIEQCLVPEAATIQMMLCGSIERMRAAAERMLELPWVAGVGDDRADAAVALHKAEYPERDLCLLDILPGGCSKGVALTRLAASLGIENKEIMAFGDNWNDLSMLEIAGSPVLMGNAPEDLQAMARERGWQVAGLHHEDGVAVVVEELLAAEALAR